jgi:hypothetical protein
LLLPRRWFAGDLATCEALFQELLSRTEYAALSTSIPSLAAEAMRLVTAVISVADGKASDLDALARALPVEFPKGLSVLEEAGSGRVVGSLGVAKPESGDSLNGGEEKQSAWGRVAMGGASGESVGTVSDQSHEVDAEILAMRTPPDGLWGPVEESPE